MTCQTVSSWITFSVVQSHFSYCKSFQIQYYILKTYSTVGLLKQQLAKIF